jgi:hypothetical protein
VCESAPTTWIRPALSQAERKSRCLPFAQASFNFFRHQIERGKRIMGSVFGNKIGARKLVVNARAELMWRRVGVEFVQMHTCPHRTRSILTDSSDLLIDCFAQFIGEFYSFRPNQDIHGLLFRFGDFRFSDRVRVQRRSESDICIHKHSFLELRDILSALDRLSF